MREKLKAASDRRECVGPSVLACDVGPAIGGRWRREDAPLTLKMSDNLHTSKLRLTNDDASRFHGRPGRPE